MPALIIKNLKAKIENQAILRGVDLKLPGGEVHVIMGPNGSGKSTLANVILANPAYTRTSGTVSYGTKNLSKLTPDKIAQAGVMLAFQQPQTIPGVTLSSFLTLAARKHRGPNSPVKNSAGVVKEIKTTADALELPQEFLSRSLNEGFSGGEKKKAEILQLSVLDPKVLILDEIDSGLDVDALKLVSKQINVLRKKGTSILLITHYHRLLTHVHADRVHVMHKGVIVRSGGKSLAVEIEKNGYAKYVSAKK
jgi:Fe-S cluster assembly ATP-binding protein